MLGRPDNGTRIDSVIEGAANSSIPPARSCDSISGSPPSWLLANTVTLSRPEDCSPIARAASVRRTVSGWVSGVLTPSLKSNSAAARTGLANTVVAVVAAAPSSARRVIVFVIFVSLPSAIGPRLGRASNEAGPPASPHWPAQRVQNPNLATQRNHFEQ